MPDSDIKIIRSHRSSISLSLTSDGSVVVKAPKLMPMFLVNAFIKQQEGWIERQKTRLQRFPKAPTRLYKKGEKFMFLGNELTLEIGDFPKIEVKGDMLLFPVSLQFRAQKELATWYKKQAERLITKQIEYYAHKMRTSYASLKFSDTKSQWGSCSRENNIQFSWKLVMTPLPVLNYVVVHELSHTLQKNHGKDFWDIVRVYAPSYNAHRRWLKNHQNMLTV